MAKKIFAKVQRELIPKCRDKFPFLYLEKGRIEIDFSSVKFISHEGDVIPIPAATIASLLLGPGISITHDAIKTLATCNCFVNWVGEDGLLFYAHGESPTSNTKNFNKQLSFASHSKKRLQVAKLLFGKRFPKEVIEDSTLQQLMTLEGRRVKEIYTLCAEKYAVPWRGRSYKPGKMTEGDTLNQLLTSSNAALYGLISSVIHSMGYSPHIGFIHKGSPLPFVYDLADLYKNDLSIDFSFSIYDEIRGAYDRKIVLDYFRERVSEYKLLEKIPKDIAMLFDDSSHSK